MADEIKILFSDGDKVFLELCKIHLRKSGVNILTCQNGKDTLNVIRKIRPHLAVIAADLPVINGYDCCKIVRSVDSLKKIPVLIALSSGKWQEVDRCREAGCDEVILKPINRHIFYEVIGKYVTLNKRAAPRFRVRFPVNWTGDDRQRNTGKSVNISTKGIFLETEVIADLDSIISIDFTLPVNNVEIKCKARVSCVYKDNLQQKPSFPKGIALEYVDLSKENLSYISEYIRKEHIEPLLT